MYTQRQKAESVDLKMNINQIAMKYNMSLLQADTYLRKLKKTESNIQKCPLIDLGAEKNNYSSKRNGKRSGIDYLIRSFLNNLPSTSYYGIEEWAALPELWPYCNEDLVSKKIYDRVLNRMNNEKEKWQDSWIDLCSVSIKEKIRPADLINKIADNPDIYLLPFENHDELRNYVKRFSDAGSRIYIAKSQLYRLKKRIPKNYEYDESLLAGAKDIIFNVSLGKASLLLNLDIDQTVKLKEMIKKM